MPGTNKLKSISIYTKDKDKKKKAQNSKKEILKPQWRTLREEERKSLSKHDGKMLIVCAYSII